MLADKKLYVEVEDLDQLAKIVEEYLIEYNSISRTPMNLVLFRSRPLQPSFRFPSNVFARDLRTKSPFAILSPDSPWSISQRSAE